MERHCIESCLYIVGDVTAQNPFLKFSLLAKCLPEMSVSRNEGDLNSLGGEGGGFLCRRNEKKTNGSFHLKLQRCVCGMCVRLHASATTACICSSLALVVQHLVTSLFLFLRFFPGELPRLDEESIKNVIGSSELWIRESCTILLQMQFCGKQAKIGKSFRLLSLIASKVNHALALPHARICFLSV